MITKTIKVKSIKNEEILIAIKIMKQIRRTVIINNNNNSDNNDNSDN